MVNLEQAISIWRQQMLAAGIKTPAPLEELESHLRDEIERQTKTGFNQQDAFAFAVQKFGSADTVQNEFKKAEKDNKIFWATMLIVGWLAASYTLLHSIAGLDDNWNWASFSSPAIL